MNPLVSNTSLDMTLVQGNSRDIIFNVKGDGFAGISLSDVDDIVWSFFRSLDNNSPIASKSLGSGITVTDPDGVFKVSLVPSDTDTKSPGNYLHEAVITMDGGEVYTVVNSSGNPGKFILRKIGTLPS